MSVKAYNYAHKLTVAPNGEPITPTEKLVLYALAWHHNGPSGRCDPSTRRLAEKLLLDRSTVIRTLQALERKDVIQIEHRRRKHNRSSTSNAYTFLALEHGSTVRPPPGGTVRPPLVAQDGQGGSTVRPPYEHETEHEDRTLFSEGEDKEKERGALASLSENEDNLDPRAFAAAYDALARSGLVRPLSPKERAALTKFAPVPVRALGEIADYLRTLRAHYGVTEPVQLPTFVPDRSGYYDADRNWVPPRDGSALARLWDDAGAFLALAPEESADVLAGLRRPLLGGDGLRLGFTKALQAHRREKEDEAEAERRQRERDERRHGREAGSTAAGRVKDLD